AAHRPARRSRTVGHEEALRLASTHPAKALPDRALGSLPRALLLQRAVARAPARPHKRPGPQLRSTFLTVASSTPSNSVKGLRFGASAERHAINLADHGLGQAEGGGGEVGAGGQRCR